MARGIIAQRVRVSEGAHAVTTRLCGALGNRDRLYGVPVMPMIHPRSFWPMRTIQSAEIPGTGTATANATKTANVVAGGVGAASCVCTLSTCRSGIILCVGIDRLPFRRSPSKLCAMLAVSNGLRLDGVLYLISPGPGIQPKTSFAVEARWTSEQADGPVLLRVDSINKRYADEIVLADVAFDVHAGEILGIIGPNGAGKTTLLEVLAGIPPRSRATFIGSEGCCRRRVGEKPCSTYRTACGLIRTNPLPGFYRSLQMSIEDRPTRSPARSKR